MSSLDTAEPSMKEGHTVLEKPAVQNSDVSNNEDPKAQARDWRFWMVFIALSITGTLSAIEATIITTALPTIVHDLKIGDNYGWIPNAYFLTRLA
jgi:hypothetical protein